MCRKPISNHQDYFSRRILVYISGENYVHTNTVLEYGFGNQPKLQFLHKSWLLEAIFKV